MNFYIINHLIIRKKAQRPPGLYGESKGIFGRIKKNLHAGVAGIENVYTRHVPLLAKVLDSVFKANLSATHYPFFDGRSDSRSVSTSPTKVLVWISGGTTYEESAHIAALNSSNSGISILLGGSCVQNSSSFLRELSLC